MDEVTKQACELSKRIIRERRISKKYRYLRNDLHQASCLCVLECLIDGEEPSLREDLFKHIRDIVSIFRNNTLSTEECDLCAEGQDPLSLLLTKEFDELLLSILTPFEKEVYALLKEGETEVAEITQALKQKFEVDEVHVEFARDRIRQKATDIIKERICI